MTETKVIYLSDLTESGAMREVKHWRNNGVDIVNAWRTNARRYAKTHGQAMVVRCDGRMIWYARDTVKGTVRQATYCEGKNLLIRLKRDAI